MFKYRKCQQEAIDKSVEYIKGKSKAASLVVLPTAGGKSHTIAGIAKEYLDPILILQPNKELLEQNYSKYIDFGGEASVFSASLKRKEIGHVTYATLGSIKNNAADFKKLGVNLLLVDEAHHSYSPDAGSSFMNFVEELTPEKTIGFTATPFRLKNNMEGSRLVMINRTRPGYFKKIIHVTQIQEMIDEGFWSESVDEAYHLDESGLILNSTGSEFSEESIKEANKVNGTNNKIFKRIVKALPERKHILVFTDGADTAEKFAEFFNEKIFKGERKAAFVTSKTSAKQRKQDVKDFKSGKIQVMFNYSVFGTGFDFPELDCIIMGRATNSLALWYQIYGRGVRVFEGKLDFLMIDYGNNFHRLGNPRKITIEDYPGAGWAVFSEERLITNVILGFGEPITKDMLRSKERGIKKGGWFFKNGKHAGEEYETVAEKDPGYILYLLGKLEFEDNSEMKSALEQAIFQAELNKV